MLIQHRNAAGGVTLKGNLFLKDGGRRYHFSENKELSSGIYILYYTTFQTIPLRDMLPSTAEALNDEEQGKADVHLQT